MFQRMTPTRLLRLCLKELRESLRDRRTIVTLILMPLLVYPVLSLVLNRVLVTSLTGSRQIELTIGIGTELRESQLPAILAMGYGLVNDREAAPVFLEEVVQDGKLRSASRNEDPVSLPRPQLLALQGDGREALRNGSVDLVITRKSLEEIPEGAKRDGRRALDLLLKQFALADGSVPKGFDPAALLDLVGHYEVRYRQGETQSERALQLLERILAAFNNEATRELVGGGYEAPIRLRVTPVVMKGNYADLLATLVPLVLVLMTMAGAVYPAIDLTAGERERGTMEALIVSPTPNWALLLSKYSAVVMVALLTALANLAAMTITLWVSGIGKLIFGEGVLSTGVIGTVLVLLVLFTMFFAALLLAVTSFAKSFKEAQAYLIPLMLLALTPGVMSLLPGLKFTGLLATVPLVNIVLLARLVLVGGAEWNTAMVAVICNGVYALAALAVASRLFGSDASMHGSQGSWRDLLMRPLESRKWPGMDQMALTMAVMFPMYFIASSTLPSVSGQLSTRLWVSAGVSMVLILGVPLLVAWYRKIGMISTFRLGRTFGWRWMIWLPAIVLVSGSAWMLAHEIFIAGQLFGIGTIDPEKFEQVAEFRDELRRLPLWMVLFVFALTPAVCEEFLFRGFVLSAMNQYSRVWAVVLSAAMFGLMHVLTSNVLAVERFLPAMFMGLILGLVAIRTGSIWPGVLLHALHNGGLLSLSYYQERLSEMKILVVDGEHLPATWLVCGIASLVLGIGLFWLSTRTEFREKGRAAVPQAAAGS